MSSPHEVIAEVQTQLANALVDMNSTVVESVYTGICTATDDKLEIIQAAVKMATNMTLLTLEDHAIMQLTCVGDEGGEEPLVSFDRLSDEFDRVYTEAINT